MVCTFFRGRQTKEEHRKHSPCAVIVPRTHQNEPLWTSFIFFGFMWMLGLRRQCLSLSMKNPWAFGFLNSNVQCLCFMQFLWCIAFRCEPNGICLNIYHQQLVDGKKWLENVYPDDDPNNCWKVTVINLGYAEWGFFVNMNYK